MDQQQASNTFLQVASEYGIFAALFIILLLAVLYVSWYLFKASQEDKKKIVEINAELIKNNSEIAKRYQDINVEIKDLMVTLNGVNKNLFDQLDFLKKNCQKQNFCIIDAINILIKISQDDDVRLRLESIIKEIQRPVE